MALTKFSKKTLHSAVSSSMSPNLTPSQKIQSLASMESTLWNLFYSKTVSMVSTLNAPSLVQKFGVEEGITQPLAHQLRAGRKRISKELRELIFRLVTRHSSGAWGLSNFEKHFRMILLRCI
jgi:hypothetical protein